MRTLMGYFSKGYAWLLDVDGQMIDQGWNQNLEMAQHELSMAVRTWHTARREEEYEQQ